MAHLLWWEAPEGEKSKTVFDLVSQIESTQCDIFDRFLKLQCLYDPNDRAGLTGANAYTGSGPDANVSENVIASNIDTVTAVIASTEVRARFMTDDADWSTQRTARHLEWYADGLAKLLKVPEAARMAFKDGALKGTGMVKVYCDGDSIVVERVLVDNIIVDESETRSGALPRQMHQRVFVDREVLKSRFPDHSMEIDRAQSDSGNWRYWADYRPIERNDLVAIESWRLPTGVKGSDRYKPGRHTICIDGTDLLDEQWDKPFFPFAKFAWSDRITGWYGIGLAERIAGHQRALNKLNWQIDRQLDQLAVPTTYVRMADANLAVKTTNRAGTIVPIKGDYPQTIMPAAVSGETYARREQIKDSSFEESGLSRMAAQSKKPAGIESGVALREYRDQTTERFAQQERGYEQLHLDIVWLALDCAKTLGSKAPVIVSKAKRGTNKIPWSKVDMGEVRVQIAAASTLSKTPAGRTQTVLEWAQAGIISQDEARRLLRHPDLARAMSLYDAGMEDIERVIESILDGDETLVPEPYQNLKAGVWRVNQAYLKACDDGAPEDIKEALRQWLVQAAWLVSLAEAPPPQAPAPVPASDMAMGPPAPELAQPMVA